jgi:RHS repeat-associated protein
MHFADDWPGSNYAYTLGLAGNRLTVAELSGRAVNYGYDSLYRLTTETVTSDPHNNDGAISYTYDAVGNRKTLNSTLPPEGGMVYAYDADDRLGSDQYDADGNTVNSFGIVNAYDFENHMITHGGVTLVYDGDGNRVSETVGGVTTNHLVDTQNLTGYAQVVDELQGGTVARTYAYGLERISEDQVISSTWTASFYGYDGHGSVRQLTNSAGAVTDTYDYDAFGNLINSTGSTPNVYLFAGEQFDPALGLYYNRARYLNTTTGRFWSMDTDEGGDQDPISLHKYLYSEGNPVNNLDPTGNEIDAVASFSVDATLESFSLPNINGVINAALPIPPYPSTQPARQLVGAVYGESSTPSSGGGEYPDEKIAIAETFAYQAYFATVYPKFDKNFGDGSLWGAIQKNSLAVGGALWNQVMDGSTSTCDLKGPETVGQALQGAAARTHFIDSVIAVNEIAAAVTPASQLLLPVPELNPQVPVGFNKASNSPPSPRMQKIGRIGSTTFYGFKPGRAAQ